MDTIEDVRLVMGSPWPVETNDGHHWLISFELDKDNVMTGHELTAVVKCYRGLEGPMFRIILEPNPNAEYTKVDNYVDSMIEIIEQIYKIYKNENNRVTLQTSDNRIREKIHTIDTQAALRMNEVMLG